MGRDVQLRSARRWPERRQLVNARTLTRVSVVVAALALPAGALAMNDPTRSHTNGMPAVSASSPVNVVPTAHSATPTYDGYKSGYPQLHQILTYATAAARHTAAPAVVLPGRGFAWRDAGIGLLVGLLAASLVTVSLSQLRRNRNTVLP